MTKPKRPIRFTLADDRNTQYKTLATRSLLIHAGLAISIVRDMLHLATDPEMKLDPD
jgi:hypothetical protein